MPELPEITSRAREMHEALSEKVISGVDIVQPKCLNCSIELFLTNILGKRIIRVSNRGKWIIWQLSQGWLLINLGMGGEVLLVDRQKLPKKHKVILDFTDQTCLAINFWWFGYVHFCSTDPLIDHPMVSKLGPNILDVALEDFDAIIADSKKKQLKSVLLDQSNLAGIGNAYIHDILFLAKLHPTRPCSSLSNDEKKCLYAAIHDELELSLAKSGAFYELDLFGQKGGFQLEDILVGYREGKPCPVCSSSIIKIKTGSTSSFLCPSCQK